VVAFRAMEFDLHGRRFEWLRAPQSVTCDGDRIVATAAPHSDNFRAPDGSNVATSGAVAVTEAPDGDWQFQARVSAGHRSSWDAATIVLWHDERRWAKLCFELSPQGRPSVMSVVTRDRSDDAVGWPIDGGVAWLRVSCRDGAYYFHVSTDGSVWALARQFELGTVSVRVGIGVQSPVGEGCVATFDNVTLTATRLEEIFT
jgi:uncharacterized protein